MSESKVFMFDNSGPEMQAAYAQARATFRYFWRARAPIAVDRSCLTLGWTPCP